MNRTLALIAAIVVLAAIIIFVGPAACNRIKSMAAQSKVAAGQAGAARESSADAIGTVSKSGAREATSEDLTRSNEKEIRNAPGADQSVDPRATAAGVRSLCRRAATRNDPKCRVLEPHP